MEESTFEWYQEEMTIVEQQQQQSRPRDGMDINGNNGTSTGNKPSMFTLGRSSRSSMGSLARSPSARAQSSRALPESISYRVRHSWDVLSGDPERMSRVGVTFFLRMFEDHPYLLDLFPFGNFLEEDGNGDDDGMDSSTRSNGSARSSSGGGGYYYSTTKERRCKLPGALKAHALIVTETIGKFVTGLTRLEDLVPMLRALGHVHDSAGVQPEYYDVMLKYMIEAVGDELDDVDEWDDETEEAWELAFKTIVNIITRPNERLQVEPLEGWGSVCACACAYLAFLAPVEVAGFAAPLRYTAAGYLLDAATAVALACLFVDMVSRWLADKLRPKHRAKPPERKGRYAIRQNLNPSWLRRKARQMAYPVCYRAFRYVRRLRMERWENWPRTDFVVLLSFLLQHACHCAFSGGVGEGDGGSVAGYVDDGGAGTAEAAAATAVAAAAAAAGVHWTCSIALVRMVAGVRVLHFWTCAENNIMLRRRVDSDERTKLRVAKLIVAMLLTIHCSACLWCLVARVELGPSAADATASAFFPHPEYLLGGAGIVKSYVHCCHWAWVNLAGIGDCDSTPDSTLETLFTLLVHFVGLTLYAIMTGNVVQILSDITEKQNETGNDLSTLGDFMHECCIPQCDQRRILHGYLMQEMSGAKDSGGAGGERGGGGGGAAGGGGGDGGGVEDDSDLLTVPEVARKLPSFLRQEISLFARAQAIKLRETAFYYCSNDFLFAMTGGLSETRILLPGDYLCNEDEHLPNRVFLVDDGKIDVVCEGKCLRTLRRGDVIGKRWLLDAPVDENDKEERRWTALRALTPCKIIYGLEDRKAINELRERYPKDFSLLRYQRNQCVKNMQRRVSSRDNILGWASSSKGQASSISNPSASPPVRPESAPPPASSEKRRNRRRGLGLKLHGMGHSRRKLE